MTDTDTAKGGFTPAFPQRLYAPGTAGPPLYERVGGARAVGRIVDDLYLHVLSDRQLFPYFGGFDLPSLKHHMVLVPTGVLGGPRGHGRRDLAAAHRELRISGEHYDRVSHVVLGVPWENGAGADAMMHVTRMPASARVLFVPRLSDGPARSA
ncbi:hypothetical protein ABT278_34285 [Streptomyces sp. NPDC001228]|uniref:globin domain-containing protein n=1 Tax=Streptomyces sp. NPDC001228 TaxID=3154381 RepID=UPI00332F1E9A